MMVLYSPQLNETDTITYEFAGDVVTATYNGQSDEFDFTDCPDGVLDVSRESGIETTLPIVPLVGAERKDGVLYVTLIKFIDNDAPYEERFPEWVNMNG